ncbi:NADH:flavin oxidoreductase [Paenibacillaceae bacterium WGS1546]|uniref:NADH:flavin oxidoreductase n=1 Tax=Cohnella sp. WGS1546 TaxID=3366810 RepID=UPI00372D3A8B
MEKQIEALQDQIANTLFKPFAAGSLRLDNRVVMAPMTRSFSPGGVPGPDVAVYYKRRAENGVGLIVTEGTVINHPAATGDPNVPNLHEEKALAGWSRVVEAVHEAGGKIVPQLWHVGMTRENGSLPHPEAPSVGPSGLKLNGEKAGEPLTAAEIEAIVQAFGQAAANAKKVGFDGIEIHGAHGYLIDQFLWERTNRRTDEYGGDAVGRTRFAADVVRACREAVGPDFPIILRLSQWKYDLYDSKLAPDPDSLERLLRPLTEAGVDVFHCSTRRFWEPEFAGSELNFAGWVRKLTGKPTITVGSIGLDSAFHDDAVRGPDSDASGIRGLLDRLEHGEFDLVAIGRALLNDPAWAAKIRDGKFDELIPFRPEALNTLY